MMLTGGSMEPLGTSTMSPISSTTSAVETVPLVITTAGSTTLESAPMAPSPISFAGSVTDRISPRMLTTPQMNSGTQGTGVTS